MIDSPWAQESNLHGPYGPVDFKPPPALFHGLIEEADPHLPAGDVDLAYSLAVPEHVRNVDEVVSSILGGCVLGGLCFVVPMNEFVVNGDLPDCRHEDSVAGHVRTFTEASLRARFGALPGFTLEKIPGEVPKHHPPHPHAGGVRVLLRRRLEARRVAIGGTWRREIRAPEELRPGGFPVPSSLF